MKPFFAEHHADPLEDILGLLQVWDGHYIPQMHDNTVLITEYAKQISDFTAMAGAWAFLWFGWVVFGVVYQKSGAWAVDRGEKLS